MKSPHSVSKSDNIYERSLLDEDVLQFSEECKKFCDNFDCLSCSLQSQKVDLSLQLSCKQSKVSSTKTNDVGVCDVIPALKI